MLNKMRKSVAEWLYPKGDLTLPGNLTSIEAVGVLREQIEKGEFELINEKLDNLKVEIDDIPNRSEYLASAHRVLEEPAFREVINQLINNQLEHAVKLADSWERVLFDRATINGLALMLEEFEALEGQYQEMIRPQDNYNKHEIL